MSATVEFMEIKETMSVEVSVYTYDARASVKAMEVETSESIVDGFSIWYGYTPLALMVIAGVAGIVGSLMVGKNGKILLAVTGALTLLSVIIFAAGLQSELSKLTEATGGTLPSLPEVGLFSSGSYSFMGVSMDYSSYLTFGFWLALIAAIIAFISVSKHPMAPPATPPTPES
jgi:hypothetical protein